jgi:hypothetical protein
VVVLPALRWGVAFCLAITACHAEPPKSGTSQRAPLPLQTVVASGLLKGDYEVYVDTARMRAGFPGWKISQSELVRSIAPISNGVFSNPHAAPRRVVPDLLASPAIRNAFESAREIWFVYGAETGDAFAIATGVSDESREALDWQMSGPTSFVRSQSERESASFPRNYVNELGQQLRVLNDGTWLAANPNAVPRLQAWQAGQLVRPQGNIARWRLSGHLLTEKCSSAGLTGLPVHPVEARGALLDEGGHWQVEVDVAAPSEVELARKLCDTLTGSFKNPDVANDDFGGTPHCFANANAVVATYRLPQRYRYGLNILRDASGSVKVAPAGGQ